MAHVSVDPELPTPMDVEPDRTIDLAQVYDSSAPARSCQDWRPIELGVARISGVDVGFFSQEDPDGG